LAKNARRMILASTPPEAASTDSSPYPNGSGKTTTRRMIMSILCPDNGRVRILDKLNPSAATTVASIWAAAKIFRNGILMQGKAARPTELRCWITAK